MLSRLSRLDRRSRSVSCELAFLLRACWLGLLLSNSMVPVMRPGVGVEGDCVLSIQAGSAAVQSIPPFLTPFNVSPPAAQARNAARRTSFLSSPAAGD